MIEYLKYAGLLFVLVVLQKTLIWLIAVTSYEITPDLVLIGIVYIAMNRGKITGTVSGFAAGIVIDMVSFSFLGLMALSKTVAGFLGGFFNNTNKLDRYLSSYVFVLVVFFCSLLNNLIYFMIYFQGTVLTPADIMLRYVVPTAIYTSFVSILPVVVNKRRLVKR